MHGCEGLPNSNFALKQASNFPVDALETGGRGGLIGLFQTKGLHRSYAQGQDILLQGVESDSVVLLLEGCAFLQRMLFNGKRQIIDLVMPGCIIGFDGQKGLTLSLYAKTDCTVASMSRSELRRHLLHSPEICLQCADSFASSEGRAFARISQVGQLKAKQRVASLIVEFALRMRNSTGVDCPAIILPITQIDIADMLGLAHETVCRAMAEMRHENLATWGNTRIEIHDLDGLVECSGLDWEHLGYTGPTHLAGRALMLKSA